MDRKTALVTGSGRGIGRTIALALAKDGIDIIVNDVNRDSAEETSKLVEELGVKSLVSTTNIVNRIEVDQMFEEINSTYGKLDILVNNAGITRDNFLLKMTEEEWDSVINVNLKGVFNCTQSAAKVMTQQKSGRIVNLSSASGQMGNIGQTNYSASKAGVIGMTKTLAKELARYNITVNAVAPGFISTPMTENLPDKVKDYLIKMIPLGRAGEAEEVAKAVKFLVSEDSTYITGQVLAVNGGMYL